MRSRLSYVTALLLMWVAAFVPASSALQSPLKPRRPLQPHNRRFRRRVLDFSTSPPPPTTAGALADDIQSSEYGYYSDYEYMSPLPPMMVAPEPQPPVDPEYRGIKLAFHYTIHPSREQVGEGDYVREKLMPAVAASLRRSIRVRRPTGPIKLDEVFFPGVSPEAMVEFIQAAFGAANRTELDKIIQRAGDADFLLEVSVPEENSVDCETPGGQKILGFAAPIGMHEVTFRPLIGNSTLCTLKDFQDDQETMLHETLHALGMVLHLFSMFQGYSDMQEIVEVTEEKFLPSFDQTGAETAKTLAVKTPNVLRVVREHFGCDSLTGAELEDDGGSGTAYSHWEERLFQGEMMDAAGEALNKSTFATSLVLTDLSLAFLQDSGWYDVLYGSSGFNPFGYKAGCAFANGTVEEALASSASTKYLCTPQDAGKYICTHDHVASAFCYDYDDYYLEKYFVDFYSNTEGLQDILPKVESDYDGRLCVTTSNPPGNRCVMPRSSNMSTNAFEGAAIAEPLFVDETMCVEMACSPQGDVLINGAPCNPQEYECPDSGYLCGDPGVLTCVATLNDCSAHGDCLKGACYCHLGWGGADCSIPICVPSEGCPDGGECPESGFCGVPECGAWSVGADDIGVPCNGATGPPRTYPSKSLTSSESSDTKLVTKSSTDRLPVWTAQLIAMLCLVHSILID